MSWGGKFKICNSSSEVSTGMYQIPRVPFGWDVLVINILCTLPPLFFEVIIENNSKRIMQFQQCTWDSWLLVSTELGRCSHHWTLQGCGREQLSQQKEAEEKPLPWAHIHTRKHSLAQSTEISPCRILPWEPYQLTNFECSPCSFI